MNAQKKHRQRKRAKTMPSHGGRASERDDGRLQFGPKVNWCEMIWTWEMGSLFVSHESFELSISVHFPSDCVWRWRLKHRQRDLLPSDTEWRTHANWIIIQTHWVALICSALAFRHLPLSMSACGVAVYRPTVCWHFLSAIHVNLEISCCCFVCRVLCGSSFDWQPTF